MGGLLADQAAALPSACSQSGRTVTCTYTSGSNPFTVPAGVFSIHVVAVGAAGSSSRATPGGPGAVVSGDLPVKAGSTLYAVAGANAGGQMEGGAQGGAGGAQGDSFCLPVFPFTCVAGEAGGGGGGGSDVRTSQDDLASRLLIAGGGGGAGGASAFLARFSPSTVAGGAGGGPGEAGAGGGGGGTNTNGGKGGTGGCLTTVCDGGDGGSGFGGDGGAGEFALGGIGTAASGGGGGGGGGGLFGAGAGGGGGFGAGAGGGGGGSNLVPSGGSQSVDTTGVPLVTISYAQPLPTTKEQCKNGGWSNFPEFKNQGQCIAFVNHGP